MKLSKQQCIRRVPLLLLGVLFTGCTTSDVVQIGNNTYTMSGMVRSEVFIDASNYCKKQGLMLKAVSERRDVDAGFPAILDFKCVHMGSREYQNAKYDTPKNISIKVDKKIVYK